MNKPAVHILIWRGTEATPQDGEAYVAMALPDPDHNDYAVTEDHVAKEAGKMFWALRRGLSAIK